MGTEMRGRPSLQAPGPVQGEELEAVEVDDVDEDAPHVPGAAVRGEV